MTEACARCGSSDPDRKLYPPREWITYLEAERELAQPEGVLAVPLCGDCHDRLALLRRVFRELNHLDADERAATRDRIETELNDLALETLVDETGPAPEDTQSVL